MARSIQILVESHEAIPEGCSQIFEAVGPSRPVQKVDYEADDGTRGIWIVEGRDEDDRPIAAMVVPVSDSGAGTSLLVVGGEHGLRLKLGDLERAEPYLLLAEDAIVG